jgi:Mn-dependent DtxR family transcriptional regulator
MDACRLLIKAIDAGVSLDDILAMDVTDDRLTRRLSRLVRLGLATFDQNGEVRLTREGRHVLAYIAPDSQWRFLRETVGSEAEEIGLSAFEILANRIVAHVPSPAPVPSEAAA